ncbi:MAG TPA: Lrp/AsnC family transcriptional regulator [Euryarchaeota archaeon]|nr:Lrp/AsnC family transcriptional regulator [Euryarchaeota archaeon]HDY73965.1 Lrp/AsnC family transcriptional regulator [Euryarchaeota archaeon]
MINVDLGKEISVRRELSMFEGVKELLHLFGEYDFLVIIKAGDLRQVNYIVDKIREINGVSATKTIIGAEGEE